MKACFDLGFVISDISDDEGSTVVKDEKRNTRFLPPVSETELS